MDIILLNNINNEAFLREDDDHSEQDNAESIDGCTDDRIEKSRERNREHAKKTRLRKKAMLETLKTRLVELQNEVNYLIKIFI